MRPQKAEIMQIKKMVESHNGMRKVKAKQKQHNNNIKIQHVRKLRIQPFVWSQHGAATIIKKKRLHCSNS